MTHDKQLVFKRIMSCFYQTVGYKLFITINLHSEMY